MVFANLLRTGHSIAIRRCMQQATRTVGDPKRSLEQSAEANVWLVITCTCRAVGETRDQQDSSNLPWNRRMRRTLERSDPQPSRAESIFITEENA